MPRLQSLKPLEPWVEIVATREDWNSADPKFLTDMLVQTQLVRTFEETVLDLAANGLIHGPAHSSIGQEGGAVGSCIRLRSSDHVNGSHRGHHQFLAKALTHVAPEGFQSVGSWTPDVDGLLHRSLAEIA